MHLRQWVGEDKRGKWQALGWWSGRERSRLRCALFVAEIIKADSQPFSARLPLTFPAAFVLIFSCAYSFRLKVRLDALLLSSLGTPFIPVFRAHSDA